MGGNYQWPKLEEVVEFRAKVREVVRRVIWETPLDIPVSQDSPWVSVQYWLYPRIAEYLFVRV